MRRLYRGAPQLLRTAVAPVLRFDDPLSALHWQLGIPPDYGRRGLPRHDDRHVNLVECDKHLMTPETRDAWQALRDAAQRDGVNIKVNWGYRTVEEQARLIRHAIRCGWAMDSVLQRMAAPGYSEHHTGRALDIVTDTCDGEGFESTSEYAWLRDHAGEYGFRQTYPPGSACGLRFEPWHWCWHPPPGA